MSFSVVLYRTTSPRIKIDKRLTWQNTVTGVLYEENEDLDAPIIELDQTVTENISERANFYNCNYVHIPIFNKYFYVVGREIVDNDHYILRLRLDVLKTYAAQIKAESAWITRTADPDLIDWYLPDGNVPLLSETNRTEAPTGFYPINPGTGTPDFNTFLKTYRYILSAAQAGVSTTFQHIERSALTPDKEGITYYPMTLSTLINVVTKTMDGTSFLNWGTGDPKSALLGIHALPFILDVDETNTDFVYLGKFNTEQSTGRLTSLYNTKTSGAIQLATPKDYRVGTGDYSIRIYLPLIGWRALDTKIVSKKPYLRISYKTNVLTGSGRCILYLLASDSAYGDRDIYDIIEYNCAVSIPLTVNTTAEKQRNAMTSMIATGLSVAGAVITKNPAFITSAIGAAGSALVNSALTPVEYRSVSQQSGECIDTQPTQVMIQYLERQSPVLDSATGKDNYRKIHGVRCDKFLQISSITADMFSRCSNWWMTPPVGATEEHLKEIKTIMEGGFMV